MANNNANNDNRPLRDFAAPRAADLQLGYTVPAITVHNFELKPAFMNAAAQNQFSGSPHDDPINHLTNFVEITENIYINGVTRDAIKLRLFPFSLRDRAKNWLRSLPPGSITTWEQMSNAFLSKYFPPSKTASYRNQITNFKQKPDESLCEAWDKYQELLRLCPHHGLEKWLILQTFYDGLNYNTRMTLDAAAGGSLMSRSQNEAYNLIEEMALN